MTLSAREIAARRRDELFSDRTVDLPLNGYADLYHVRYRILPFEELRKVGKRVEKQTGLSDEEREIVGAADTLIVACVGFLDAQTGDLLGYKWGVDAARDLFGVDLDAGSTARVALRQVLPSTQLMLHFEDYAQRQVSAGEEVDDELAGESVAASAASSLSAQEPPILASTFGG